MARLLIEDSSSTCITRVGGSPSTPPEFVWPMCKCCGGHMQFLAQIALPETNITGVCNGNELLLLFQCQNDPGLCDEWDADAGGNAAIIVPMNELNPATPPAGPTTLPSVSRVRVTDYDDTSTDVTADDNYCLQLDSNPDVLGKLGGVPLWIQGDETPRCSCGKAMGFIAQLEARGGGGINFGDVGAGYAFACKSCDPSAKFLWQCG